MPTVVQVGIPDIRVMTVRRTVSAPVELTISVEENS